MPFAVTLETGGGGLKAVAGDDEVAEVAAAFTDAGIPVEVRAWIEGQGAGAFQWVLMITVPTTAFLTAMAAEAGKDAYKVLKRLVGRIHKARIAAGRTAGWTTDSVAVIDEQTNTWVLLPPDLPEEAWRALSDVGMKELATDSVLRWDPDTGTWQDAWDEYR